MRNRNRIVVALAAFFALLGTTERATASAKQEFRVAWSLYVGWMPWDYAARSGILKKWSDRHGIEIELVRVDDYAKSISQYTAGKFDGCAMTNMDVLTGPAAQGVDSTALIVGDFSNGNDGIVLKGAGRKLADLRNQPVNLVELSVSHYLLARALETAGLSERDVRIINTSDADIVQLFPQPGIVAAAAWKPQLAEILAGTAPATLVFDSSRIPGEIMDLMVVNTAVLRSNPAFGRAMTGAWYEALGVIFGHDARAGAAIASMAKAAGTEVAQFKRQLGTTKMFVLPAEAHGFMAGSSVVRTMDLVRAFSFRHGLLGDSAKNVDSIGIQFPREKVLGDGRNVKVRFDPTYTQLAASGKL
jgi:NitT/TauT family transport system substrate-binding protein